MNTQMMFAAIAGVMIAVGLLAIIKMHKNPSSEKEMTMNDGKLPLSKECSKLLDASIESNVPIVLDMGEDFCPTLYVTEGERGTFYNLAGFESIDDNATVVAVVCDVDKKRADDGLKLLPKSDSLFK